jgi:hypothetical protein
MNSQPAGRPGFAGTGLEAALRSRSRVARSARAIVRWSTLIAGLALGVFHLYLFWDRLVGGDLLEPAVALRWLSAAGLVSALAILRRMGVPLTRGRKAGVVWLLVVLLHASGRATPVLPPETANGFDASVVFALPSTLLVVGVGLLCASAARRSLAAFAIATHIVDIPVRQRLCDGWRRGGSTRGPPIVTC